MTAIRSSLPRLHRVLLCLRRTGLALASMLVGTSCSFLIDPNTRQCSTTKDCEDLGSDFAGTVCAPEQVCLKPSSSAAPVGAQDECKAKEDCQTRLGAGFACNDLGKCEATCTTHTECSTRLADAAICRSDHLCAPLYARPVCTEVIPAGAETRDDMFLVGFMGILDGTEKSYGLAQKGGAAVALNELQGYWGGLPASGTIPKRTLAMLACDHGNVDGLAAARHLVNTLRVPAIIGGSYSSVTQIAFENVARPNGVLMFSPASTSPGLTSLADFDLLWRTVPSDFLQAGALKAIVPMLVEALYSKGTIARGTPPTIAIPFKDDAAGRGLKESVLNAPDPVSGLFHAYKDDQVKADPAYQAERAQAIIDQQPQIILHLGTGEFIQYIVPLIEERWTGKDRPWYIVPEGDLEKLKEMQTEPLLTQYKISERLIGTAPGSRRNDLWRKFASNYEGAEPGNLAEFAYDAVYLLGYAIGATGKQNPTGQELAEGLRKLSCKGMTRVPAGPADFQEGWKGAQEGCLDYHGPSGELDFLPAGEAETDISLGCLQKRGTAYAFTRIDTYYPITEGKLTPYKNLTLVDFSSPDWCTPLVL